MHLKYLFTTQYSDGTSFSQTEEDVSAVDPSKSAFFDVLNAGKTIRRFHLTGEGHTYTVDLSDCHFEIDGIPFFTEADKPLPLPPGHPLFQPRLIYYRTRRLHFTVDYRQVGEETEYVIGWEMTVQGRNYQQKVRVA